MYNYNIYIIYNINTVVYNIFIHDVYNCVQCSAIFSYIVICIMHMYMHIRAFAIMMTYVILICNLDILVSIIFYVPLIYNSSLQCLTLKKLSTWTK